MAYSQTDYYDAIVERQIRIGRATSKTEVMHQALELLDTLTRHHGPERSTPQSQVELVAMLKAGMASPKHTLADLRRKMLAK